MKIGVKGKSGLMSRYNSRETTAEKLWRFRGVLFLVSIPILLICAVMLMMPSTSMHSSFSDEKFAIVIDAGSTGSRVHIFRFNTAGGALDLESDTFEQLKPGLSAYAANPEESAASLKPLLDKALATVPADHHKSTTVEVRATAGLRLLPDGQADGILKAVRAFLKNSYPFKCDSKSVSILDGADEGAFAWLTLNYLLGHLGGGIEKTVAAIDMGGGSIQMAYAVDDATAKAAPSKDYIYKLAGGGKSYNVYVRSQLNYGLMAGRKGALEAQGAQHSCIPGDFSGTYKYGGKDVPVGSHPDGQSVDRCMEVITSSLKPDEPCGKQAACSFNGAWGGGMGPGASKIYVSSYFFDRGMESSIIPNEDAISWDSHPVKYKEAARQACSMSAEQIQKVYPKVQPDHAPYFCLDLSYAYSMLVNGFRIPEDAPMTIVSQITYKGDNLEAQWPLGAAINSLS